MKNAKFEESVNDILSGQKLNKNAKNGIFWRVFESLKFMVKQCYQTAHFHRTHIGGKCKVQLFSKSQFSQKSHFRSQFSQKSPFQILIFTKSHCFKYQIQVNKWSKSEKFGSPYCTF